MTTNTLAMIERENAALRARVTELQARSRTAEAENRRLRTTLEQIAHNEYTDNQIDETIQTALAASAPETKAGERAAVAEALLQWAAIDTVQENHDTGVSWCPLCNVTSSEFAYNEEPEHATNCLHLRAKALRARASVAGGGEE